MCITTCTSVQFGSIWHFLWPISHTYVRLAKGHRSMQNKNALICMRNAELCDAGILIFFLSVMCSFSCWLVIQSLAVSATCSIFWALQSMWIKHMFQIFCFTTWCTTRNSSRVVLLFLFVAGANPKKPSAPDMFTESDDMFAADFDVSIFLGQKL